MPEEEAKDEPALKAETATENAPQEKTAEPSKTAPDREGAAAGRLVMAKSIARKNLTAARKRYQEIIDKYPGTEAATEAATLLEK
jgi:TolA-binding protein